MNQISLAAHRRGSLWRRIGVALFIGLALAVAACGTTTTPGSQTTPTATVKPTTTPTPVPCTTWRIIPSPNGITYQMNHLTAVSALSPSAAWAVGGNYADSGPTTSLVERWDGTSWQVVSSPGPDFLSGVAAISPNDVWAVGSVRNEQMKPAALIAHWNGTQWSIVPGASTGPGGADLKSVVALAANDVWAVGGSDAHPLAVHWNGAAWQVVTSPTPNEAAASYLNAVTAIPGGKQLWAVGAVQYASTSGEPNYYQSLIERWDGSAWQIVASPALPSGAFGSQLYGVVATSATDAWAVGNYSASNHTIRTLIAHWNGTTWQVVTSPDTWGSLFGVAATGAHDVRTVGHSYVTAEDQPALVEQWDGAAWHVVTPPELNALGSVGLSSITTDSAGNYWAVGSYRNAAGDLKTLTAHCP